MSQVRIANLPNLAFCATDFVEFRRVYQSAEQFNALLAELKRWQAQQAENLNATRSDTRSTQTAAIFAKNLQASKQSFGAD